MGPAMELDKQPDLRLVSQGAEEDKAERQVRGEGTRGHGDLIADVIRESGLLPPEKVDQAQRRAGGDSFSQALIDEGLAGALGVARPLPKKSPLPLVALAVAGVDAEAVKLIALPVLNRVVAIPFASDGIRLKVAITDPQDVRGLDELRLATRLSVEFYVAAKNDVLTELRRLSRAAEAMNATFADEVGAAVDEEDVDDLEADDGISEAPLVRLVNSMIFQAAEDGASDIHVEPQENDLVVRYRIDGLLHVAHHIPKRLGSGVTPRLKVLAKLDIAERRKPQDGRISLNAAAARRMLDVRVAALPTVEGETIVMRLLDKSKKPPTLEELGMTAKMRERIAEIVTRPTGALLVTGPTGSGKSTTLFA